MHHHKNAPPDTEISNMDFSPEESKRTRVSFTPTQLGELEKMFQSQRSIREHLLKLWYFAVYFKIQVSVWSREGKGG